nr:uncharacterized protein [Tanacetum cinerariifolium]
MPTIKEGDVVEEFRARNDARMDSKVFGYPSDCDHDKKIHIDCACNLKFSCVIGFEFMHANFFPLLYVNIMSKKLHNSIMKDMIVYKGNNVIGALMNVPIFVGTFSVVTDFADLENMDAYRDEGMGDVIFGIGKFVFPVDFIILDIPEDIKVPLILKRSFLSTARAKIDVYKRKITLRVREEKIIFTSVKHASSLIKRVYMLSLRERMELDLEARLMGETLVLNRSLEPLFEDYIELNDLNEPIKLRRNQGALMNVPIFVGTFSVVTDFAVLENMDAYRNEGMGDVIFGEPFLREVGIKTR